MFTTQPMLSEREWGLIMDLLKAENQNVEAEPTQTPRFPNEMEERRMLIKNLIQRLENRSIDH